MCVLIYVALIGLFIYYSDYVLSQLALSADAGGGHWVVLAQGWGMVSSLWPLLVMAMLISSAVTLFVARRIWAKP